MFCTRFPPNPGNRKDCYKPEVTNGESRAPAHESYTHVRRRGSRHFRGRGRGSQRSAPWISHCTAFLEELVRGRWRVNSEKSVLKCKTKWAQQLCDPEFTPKWVSRIVVFTLKCVSTMIVHGFQPQTCTGAWCGMSQKLCVMRWRMRCGRGVRFRELGGLDH